MADTAAHLVDRVLPDVPVRQWVLSVPHALRYRLAYDAKLLGQVFRIFARVVFQLLRRRAREHPAKRLEERVEVKLPPEVLSRYTGTYRFETGLEVVVTVEDGRLMVKPPGSTTERYTLRRE